MLNLEIEIPYCIRRPPTPLSSDPDSEALISPKMELSRKRNPCYFLFGFAFISFFLLYFLEIPLSVPISFNPIAQSRTSMSKSDLQYQTVPQQDEDDENLGRLNSSKVSQASFASAFSAFDWKGYSEINMSKAELSRTEMELIEKYQESLILILTPFLEMEPRFPIDDSCRPPSLPPPSEIKCEGHGNAFSGTLRQTLPKIGILVQFGFGVDVLEIYLNEVYDVVDQFFIIEATKSHFRTLRKSLMWETVKDQPRFQKFVDKVTHFVIDDAEAAEANEAARNSTMLIDKTRIWNMESLQENLRWTKFLQWNKAHSFFSANDLIGFGDADEIPSRAMIHMMKYCEFKDRKKGRVDFGIWFPYGKLHQAFSTDFPVLGHKYTLGDPTFWTIEAANRYSTEQKQTPSRMRGSTGQFILGGIHMTHYGYFPYQLMRGVSCTECGPFSSSEMAAIEQHLKENKVRELEVKYGATPKGNMKRIVNLTTIADKMKDIAILPWFYDCNRNRYPVWENGHDTRLD